MMSRKTPLVVTDIIITPPPNPQESRADASFSSAFHRARPSSEQREGRARNNIITVL